MNEFSEKITTVSVICTAISAILGVIVYIRQQKINRLQNLISVFQRFANNDDFIAIFAACDACYVRLDKPTELEQQLNILKNIPAEKKLKYLALLEEVAILSKNSAVIRQHALHLFRFHFFYVYGNHALSDAFWYNLGSGKEEKSKDGWKYQFDFAAQCLPR